MDINSSNSLEGLDNLTPENIKQILEFKSEYDYIEQPLEKLIDCPHEIVFSITANVLSQNEKGELIDTKEILEQNYHIPVPIDKDYQNYMAVFFKYLEDKMIDAINHSNINSKEKKEEN